MVIRGGLEWEQKQPIVTISACAKGQCCDSQPSFNGGFFQLGPNPIQTGGCYLVGPAVGERVQMVGATITATGEPPSPPPPPSPPRLPANPLLPIPTKRGKTTAVLKTTMVFTAFRGKNTGMGSKPNPTKNDSATESRANTHNCMFILRTLLSYTANPITKEPSSPKGRNMLWGWWRPILTKLTVQRSSRNSPRQDGRYPTPLLPPRRTRRAIGEERG